jgi:glycine/D-amino acid oxidase-like deaminating enzyme
MDFDLVIAGAGIVGATTAYLAGQRQPEWRILLADRSLVGQGATQYSLGLYLGYGRTAAHRSLAVESEQFYRELKTVVPDVPIYDLPFYGVVNQARLSELLTGFTTGDARPASAEEFEALRRIYPDLQLGAGQVLLTASAGGYAMPAAIAAVLVRRFTSSPRKECWEGTDVVDMRRIDGGYALQIADGRVIRTARVVVATGPWMIDGLGRAAAQSFGLRVKKIVACHLDRCPGPRDPIVFFFDEDAFLLPAYERRQWLFSFTSLEWDCKPEISQLKINDADRSAAQSILERYCPSFAQHYNGGRVFCDGYSTDRVPLTAQIPELPDVVFAGGCSGSGYRLAPGIAKAALDQF